LAEFEAQNWVNKTLIHPKQLRETQTCTIKQVEQCKQTPTKHPFKNSLRGKLDSN
jgi:hypothetical protein